nr:hypothetical protein [Tanacetum cinerariifolium]
MTTLAEFMIIAGADNRPSMLDKSLYDSWKNRMEHYIENRRMILSSVQNGPLIWPTITEADGTTRTKKYEELSATEKIQADCDCKATNIILQGLPPDVYAIVYHHKVAKEIWDRTEDLDAYDSNCDDVSNAKAVLMAKLSSYGSDVLLEEHVDSLIAQFNSKMENADLKCLQDKVLVITSLKNNLRKLKGKEVENASQIPIATTVAPNMFKLDLDPLAPELLQNKEAHIYYLKHTQEQADILQEIVEQAKANHDVCSFEFVNDVNMHAKSKSKSKKTEVHNI